VADESLGYRTGERLVEAVGRDRVRAQHDEREGPPPAAPHVERLVEERQEQEAEAAAPEYPAGRPDALDDRAQAERSDEPARRQAREPGSHQPAPRLTRPAIPPQQRAGEEAEDHRPERRDEAQGLVAATVEGERLLAREEVQEPAVELRREILALVPVRREAVQVVRPVGRHADGLPVETRARHGVEREHRPECHEDEPERCPLLAPRA